MNQGYKRKYLTKNYFPRNLPGAFFGEPIMNNRNSITALAFIFPALVIYLFYFILPIPLSAYYSFFKWDGLSPEKTFILFKNWEMLFHDSIFLKSLINNIKLVISSILIQLPMGLVLGLFISSGQKGTKVFKLLYFLPMMISAVAIGIIWKYIYEANFGLLNSILNLVGLENLTRGWLGDPKTAFWAIVGTISWQYIPFYMILFAAALSGIPREIKEAAVIDGASEIVSFFYITLPLLKNTIRTASILSLTGSLKYFSMIFVMTTGGPNHASELMATYMYKQAFTNFKTGYGSTIALFMFFLSFTLTIVLLKFRKRGE
jgi:raffinose/stachyose/melibiose transport system permease protein